jgi:hypothetical protein
MRWIISIVATLALLGTPGAAAQSAKSGAYGNLSQGNQKIAEALHRSQQSDGAKGRAWSLDQIAAASQSEYGWGGVFKQMQARGLIREKNLGEIVSQNRGAPPGGGRDLTVVTTASGKTFVGAERGASRGPVRLDDRTVARADPATGRRIAIDGGRRDVGAEGPMTAKLGGAKFR